MQLPVFVQVDSKNPTSFAIHRNRNSSFEALYAYRERLSFSSLFVGLCKHSAPAIRASLFHESCLGVTCAQPETMDLFAKFCDSFLFPVMNNQLPLHENAELLLWDQSAWNAYERMNEEYANQIFSLIENLHREGRFALEESDLASSSQHSSRNELNSPDKISHLDPISSCVSVNRIQTICVWVNVRECLE